MPPTPDAPTLQPADSVASIAQQRNTFVMNTATDVAESNDPFWVFYEIDSSRWNQHFPYQLVVIRATNGAYAPASEYQTFTLPIPPQEIALQMPMAISTSVTMGGGIVEEHNAAPFRMIQFQGTMGVMPNRAAATALKTRSFTQAIFAGTIQAAKNLGNTAASINAGNQFKTTKITDADGAQNSGYLQWHLLQRFLETYVNVKKTERGADLRLGLAIWKDSSIYLVTPVEFTTRKSASSPNEYGYSIAFKAWKRITFDPTYSATDATIAPRDPSTLNQALNRLNNARRAIHAIYDLAQGVHQDADRVIETLREISYSLKDATHAVHSFMDMPKNIWNDAKAAVLAIQSSSRDFASSIKNFDFGFRSSKANVVQTVKNASVISGKADIQGGAALPSNADPFHKLVDNANKYYDFFEKIKVSQLNLPPDVIRRLNAERTRVRAFTRLDYEQRRDLVQKVAQDIADSVGAGDAAFSTVYNRGNPIANKTPTDDYYEILFQLNEVAMVLNYLAASGDIKQTVSPLAYIAGLAQKSGIVFREPRSKFAVPVPYQSTLPQIAALYLGNPDRWNEIAALNGLRYPYIDESGFDLPLIVNARLNQVAVSDATNLYIGQPVWLSAANINRTQRHVRSIERVGGAYYLVTLDGDQNLDTYTTASGATLHAYLPDTINSQMMMYIPSDKPANDTYFNTKSIPGLNIFDNLIQTGGVDLLLTPTGDLAITPDGDCKLAVGLTNIVQRVRVALSTPQGSLIRHPQFGLALTKGTNTADMDANQILRAATNLFKGDPVLGDVRAASVVKNGPSVSISVAVGLAGTDQVIPVNVTIQR